VGSLCFLLFPAFCFSSCWQTGLRNPISIDPAKRPLLRAILLLIGFLFPFFFLLFMQINIARALLFLLAFSLLFFYRPQADR
jgi:hypothetical protein